MAALRSLRGKLLILVLLALVPAMGLVLAAHMEQRGRSLDQARSEAMVIARLLAERQRQVTASARHVTDVLATLPSVRRGDWEAFSRILGLVQAQGSDYAAACVILPDQSVAACGGASLGLGQILDIPEHDLPGAGAEFTAMGSVRSPLTGRSSLLFLRRLDNQAGELLGYLVLESGLDSLDRMVESTGLPLGSTLVVGDESGTILYRWPETEGFVGRPMQESMRQVLDNLGGAGNLEMLFQDRGLDGVERIYALRGESQEELGDEAAGEIGGPGAGLVLRVGLATDSALVMVGRQLRRNLLIMFATSLMILAATRVYGNRSVLRQAAAMTTAAQRIDRGDFTSRTGILPDGSELGQLCEIFDHMAESLERREKEKTEAAMGLKRLNRALRALVACERTVILARGENELTAETCRVLVEVGGYALAWVGQAMHDEARTIKPVARFGADDGYVDSLHLSWAKESCCTLACRAMRENAPVLSRFLQAEDFPAWLHEAVVERGFHSFLALPLDVEDRRYGILSVYSLEPDALDQEEVDLLSQVAENLGFGIATLRARQDRARARELLEKAERQYRELIEYAPVGIYQATPQPQGRYLAVNKTFARMFGFNSPEELMHDVTDIAQQLYHNPDQRNLLHEDLETNGWVRDFDALMNRRHHGTFWSRRNVRAVNDEQGRILTYEGFISDVTDRKLAQDRLTHQAFHDQLTGMPNRAAFLARVEQAVARAYRNPASRYAVLFWDLDNFKLINDGYGHVLGDRVLHYLAMRFSNLFRQGVFSARLGGDEFATLVEDFTDQFEVLRAAESIHMTLSRPFVVEGCEIRASAAVGLVFGDPSYTSAEEVLRDADIAMYRAKNRGKGQTEVFDADMLASVRERMALERDLRRALETGELFLVFQPYFSLHGLALAGFEALVRWRHPEHGLIPPSRFIPVAEESGLILPLGEFVLAEACQALARWQEAEPGAGNLVMNVNLSVRQILHADPVHAIGAALGMSGLDASKLKVEITESAFMEDVDLARQVLETLASRGVLAALDDFGTGYSSMSYLRNLPVATLKIDRSFVCGLSRGGREREIVRIIVDLAHTLGMDVVAEGVEDHASLEHLRLSGCDCAQGYHLAQPLSAAEALALIAGKNGSGPSRSLARTRQRNAA